MFSLSSRSVGRRGRVRTNTFTLPALVLLTGSLGMANMFLKDMKARLSAYLLITIPLH